MGSSDRLTFGDPLKRLQHTTTGHLIGDVVDGEPIGSQIRIIQKFDDGDNGRAEARREKNLSHVQWLC